MACIEHRASSIELERAHVRTGHAGSSSMYSTAQAPLGRYGERRGPLCGIKLLKVGTACDWRERGSNARCEMKLDGRYSTWEVGGVETEASQAVEV